MELNCSKAVKYKTVAGKAMTMVAGKPDHRVPTPSVRANWNISRKGLFTPTGQDRRYLRNLCKSPMLYANLLAKEHKEKTIFVCFGTKLGLLKKYFWLLYHCALPGMSDKICMLQ